MLNITAETSRLMSSSFSMFRTASGDQTSVNNSLLFKMLSECSKLLTTSPVLELRHSGTITGLTCADWGLSTATFCYHVGVVDLIPLYPLILFISNRGKPLFLYLNAYTFSLIISVYFGILKLKFPTFMY